MADLRPEIQEQATAAGLTDEQRQHWLSKQAAEDFRRLPALGLYREMMHDRHLNKGTAWKPNDLIDMVYLSCAAGYADLLVCEHHMGSVLAQGLKRLGRATRVVHRLNEAVAAIDAALR
jgi:hypothetical protein